MLGGNHLPPTSGGQRFLCYDTERGQGESTAGRDMAEAATVFGSVLLVILLRSIERSCEFYLCNDGAFVYSHFLESGNRVTGGGFLFEGW